MTQEGFRIFNPQTGDAHGFVHMAELGNNAGSRSDQEIRIWAVDRASEICGGAGHGDILSMARDLVAFVTNPEAEA